MGTAARAAARPGRRTVAPPARRAVASASWDDGPGRRVDTGDSGGTVPPVDTTQAGGRVGPVLAGAAARGPWRRTRRAIGRLLDALGAGTGRDELLSVILFDERYVRQQVECGRRDARVAPAAGWQL